MMLLTPEQEQIGKDNFNDVVGISRRDFMKTAAAAGTGLGALYFGYGKLKGDPVKTAFIGTGDEGNVLINEHPTDYMEIVAIADMRPANVDRTFSGSHPVARRGLDKVLGAKSQDVKVYSNHKDLLAAKAKGVLDVEAVVIAVPLIQHAAVALECMEAGLHVLGEKLMAKNVTECKQMIRASEKNGVMLAVGHQRHYSVLYDNAAHLTRMGLLGDIKFIRAQWHRNNSFPGSDAWQKWTNKSLTKARDKEVLEKMEKDGSLQELGYPSARKLVDWRLFNETGGGLMAELGSHQMDAASIFLGKVQPLAVQGYGGRNFFGMEGVGPESAWNDDRDIDDQIFVTFEFPGKTYETNERDVSVVTYSSMNTNRWEPYGEAIFGSRGTLWMKTEKEALLYKEASKNSPGGVEQRIWMVDSKGSGPVLDSYETSAPAAAAATGPGETVSRGYREEMEHFCYCIRTGTNDLRCNGHVAMADAIMALAGNIAMKQKRRIEFKPEWFDASSDACPEDDEQEKTA
ncbi:MAG: Gfo/Idh/MocA family oxidoreductase [Fuerstiella sp.]|nr:Gfo/Idh/MocA family oxidoreductase [Fuerstiella sp.]MCP4857601.1 Gfo/Idh/MocA family oxidoreductase [Fuerstiella sp.]